MNPTHVRLTIPDNVDPTLLMGPTDSLLRRIEQSFDAMVTVRGNTISLVGPADVVNQITTVFSRLISQVEAGQVPSLADVAADGRDSMRNNHRNCPKYTSQVTRRSRQKGQALVTEESVGRLVWLQGG